jgi:alcohol dehydrogenase (cytochrome c)
VVTQTCLITMRCGSNISWPSVEGSVNGGRYSPLRQINVSNVRHLTVAWRLDEPSMQGGMEDYPVVVDGVAYLEGPLSTVMAVEAATGKVLWTYRPTTGFFETAYGAESRGVAVGGGRVYLLTKDDHLIALNQRTGQVIYNVLTANPHAGYSESAPVLYDDGMVFLGSAGGDSAVRGYEEARSAATGKLIWKHYNTPGVGHGWVTSGATGGGAVWMNPTPGPDGLLYFATGNPAPDLYAKDRPGADLWTDSIVAVNIRTGRTVWAHQVIPHDMWDYDSASPPVVFKTAAGWVVGEASKSGYWTELDALTGQPVTAPEPFVTEDHVMPPTGGKYVLNWPGLLGGSEYSPPSYDPQTGYAYVQGNNIPALETAAPTKGHVPGGIALGTATRSLKTPIHTGTFTAFNVGAGTIAWQDKVAVPTTGGFSTTAGGLAFAGLDNGVFEAMNAATGKVLWKTNVGTSIGDAASIYEVNGREYVLLPVGGSLQFQYSPHGYHAGYIAFALPR